MKTRILIFFLCLVSLNMMGQGTITREKCKTCGKIVSQCQYKGKHPQPQPKKASPKQPAQTPSVKICDICEKPLSKCDYGGRHPYCQTCGKLKEKCEYKGNHPAPQPSTTPVDSPVQAKATTGTLNGHEWVDLGLSVKWATCNVGASSPSDYGGYYAWGETRTKTSYNRKTYFDSNYDKYSRSRKTTLDPDDDAAHVNWGSTWRMPTPAELDELRSNCTWNWTTQNGVNGYVVVSKTNGNSLFLPAAGFRYGGYLYNAGSYGDYWSSSLNEGDSSYAYYLYFYSGGVYWRNYYRYYCHSVRPVCP